MFCKIVDRKHHDTFLTSIDNMTDLIKKLNEYDVPYQAKNMLDIMRSLAENRKYEEEQFSIFVSNDISLFIPEMREIINTVFGGTANEH